MLPNAHARVFIDDESEACIKPCAAVVPWLGKAIDIMVEEPGLSSIDRGAVAVERRTMTWLMAVA